MQSVNEIALILNEGIKTIGVKFIDSNGLLGNREYTYLTKHDHEIGDNVVVEANNRLAIVSVTRVDGDLPCIDDNHHYKFIIQKVNKDDYDRNQAEYTQLTQKIKRLMIQSKRKALKESLLASNSELASLYLDNNKTIEQ